MATRKTAQTTKPADTVSGTDTTDTSNENTTPSETASQESATSTPDEVADPSLVSDSAPANDSVEGGTANIDAAQSTEFSVTLSEDVSLRDPAFQITETSTEPVAQNSETQVLDVADVGDATALLSAGINGTTGEDITPAEQPVVETPPVVDPVSETSDTTKDVTPVEPEVSQELVDTPTDESQETVEVQVPQVPVTLTTANAEVHSVEAVEEEGTHTGFLVKTTEGDFVVKPIEQPPQAIGATEVNEQIMDELKTHLDRILADVPAVHQIPIEQVKTYLVKMAPKHPISFEEGKKYQVSLYGAIRTIVNYPEEHGFFRAQFAALLKIFELAKNAAMHESHVFRYLEYVELQADDIKAFTRLINLLIVTASVKGREDSIRQIDFNNTLQFGLTDTGRRRILDFYNA